MSGGVLPAGTAGPKTHFVCGQHLPPPSTPQLLDTLKLGWCKLGPAGAKHIAELLSFNSTLVALDLRGNELGNDGAIILGRGIRCVGGRVYQVVCLCVGGEQSSWGGVSGVWGSTLTPLQDCHHQQAH